MADIRFIRCGALLMFASLLLVVGCEEPRKNVADEDLSYIGSDVRKFELQQQLEKKYNDPQVHYELGKIYQSEGLWDKAIFEFKAARSYDPVNWQSAAGIVKAFYQDGKNTKAKILSENYIDEASYSAGSSLLLGKAFQNEMLDDEALTCYQQALRIAPESAALNKQIGYYYLAKNDLIRAEQYLRTSFNLEPSSEVAGALGRLGIAVELPRRKRVDTKELDKIIEDGEGVN